MKWMIFPVLFASSAAMADFKLAHNGKRVNCYADDNQSWVLNAKRTTLKYTVEGESLGANKVVNTQTDRKTFVSYMTDEGILTLSDEGDTFQFGEEDKASFVECE